MCQLDACHRKSGTVSNAANWTNSSKINRPLNKMIADEYTTQWSPYASIQ